MKQEISHKEALQFLIDNDLNEAIFERPINHFLQKDLLKKDKKAVQKAEIIENLSQKSDFSQKIQQQNEQTKIQPPKAVEQVFSSSLALAKLAQKSQKPASSNQAFLSLNDIIIGAKKIAQEAKNLEELKLALESFDGCNLKKMATNLVFCDGNPNSKIMIIGDAPSNQEDSQGIPFCDDSGKLLDEMLKSINVSRKENCYITNVIFWRPPGNRRPTQEELEICRPFVERHIQLINPKILVLVGATAMSAILGIDEPVTKVRGKFMDFAPDFLEKPIKSFTIFHPSYLMRQHNKKKIAWMDMLALQEFLQKT